MISATSDVEAGGIPENIGIESVDSEGGLRTVNPLLGPCGRPGLPFPEERLVASREFELVDASFLIAASNNGESVSVKMDSGTRCGYNHSVHALRLNLTKETHTFT